MGWASVRTDHALWSRWVVGRPADPPDHFSKRAEGDGRRNAFGYSSEQAGPPYSAVATDRARAARDRGHGRSRAHGRTPGTDTAHTEQHGRGRDRGRDPRNDGDPGQPEDLERRRR